MTIVSIVTVGEVPSLNNLVMKRKVDMGACFTPQCYPNETNDGLTSDSLIKVKFKQWIEDSNGNEIKELTKDMYYILKDEVESEELPTPRLFVTEFLDNLWEVTIAKPYGFKQQIEYTLSKLPFDFQDCETVKSSWLV
jgi:hypothetical protein